MKLGFGDLSVGLTDVPSQKKKRGGSPPPAEFFTCFTVFFSCCCSSVFSKYIDDQFCLFANSCFLLFLFVFSD